MLPEKLKLQILKTTAADFENQENTKLEIFHEEPCTSATHGHHRCRPSPDSQEQPLSCSWWLSSSDFDFGFQENEFFAKYAGFAFRFSRFDRILEIAEKWQEDEG